MNKLVLSCVLLLSGSVWGMQEAQLKEKAELHVINGVVKLEQGSLTYAGYEWQDIKNIKNLLSADGTVLHIEPQDVLIDIHVTFDEDLFDAPTEVFAEGIAIRDRFPRSLPLSLLRGKKPGDTIQCFLRKSRQASAEATQETVEFKLTCDANFAELSLLLSELAQRANFHPGDRKLLLEKGIMVEESINVYEDGPLNLRRYVHGPNGFKFSEESEKKDSAEQKEITTDEATEFKEKVAQCPVLAGSLEIIADTLVEYADSGCDLDIMDAQGKPLLQDPDDLVVEVKFTWGGFMSYDPGVSIDDFTFNYLPVSLFPGKKNGQEVHFFSKNAEGKMVKMIVTCVGGSHGYFDLKFDACKKAYERRNNPCLHLQDAWNNLHPRHKQNLRECAALLVGGFFVGTVLGTAFNSAQ